jgi:hypothetical protein
MEAALILREIVKLPLSDKMLILEKTIKSMRKEAGKKRSLTKGAKALLEDYKTDKELIAFTSLESDNFYETSD